jgi:hypothetical protein
LADKLGHQAELHQLNLPVDPPVQLGKASWNTISHQDVDFDPRIVKDRSEGTERKKPAPRATVVVRAESEAQLATAAARPLAAILVKRRIEIRAEHRFKALGQDWDGSKRR